MQINTNTTGMEAGLAVAADKHGRDYCVVVVKGTFEVDRDGEPRPSPTQEPVVYSDVYHGDPAATGLKYECEFALSKPRADVIVNGQAFAPNGRPVKEMTVALEVGGARKEVRVFGDRHWESGILGFKASDPVPFLTMPLVFHRAFGGSDGSHSNPKLHGAELRNTVGVGFHRNSDPATIEGQPLPNLEHPRHPMRNWSDTVPPVGFGTVGRNWHPRIKFAGTYDQKWLDERFPYLPEDFDPQYFLCAPPDQQLPCMEGGESVRCINMTPDTAFEFRIPRFDVPVVFRFRDRRVAATPLLDTLIVEPDQNRALAVWRTSTPLGRKLHDLREVVVGPEPTQLGVPLANGKRRFASLEELSAWNRVHGRPRPRPQKPIR